MKKEKKSFSYDVEQDLLAQRKIYLIGNIDDTTNIEVVQKLTFLNNKDIKKPIWLFINSGGGCLASSFSIIDTIKLINAPVISVITGEACSAAGLISLAASGRTMTRNSFWMGHDMSGGIFGDYSEKIKFRAEYLEKYWIMIKNFYLAHSKLTPLDIETLRHGELWLTSEECLKKKIVDHILDDKKLKYRSKKW